MESRTRLLMLACCLVLIAANARAQTIAGVVKDDSGAVMPGVTVEVSSPALIEKTRTAFTDGTGQYKVVSLSPGVYTVTFTLTGFSTVKREGIELSTDFTANVNAELKVGALEETITVSGTSPLVDVQSVTKQTVLTREVLDLLPTPRSIQAAGVLIPGRDHVGHRRRRAETSAAAPSCSSRRSPSMATVRRFSVGTVSG